MLTIPKFDIKEPFVGLIRDEQIYLWITKRLWDLSRDLSIFQYEIATFDSFDEDVWFASQNKPTINKVLEHYRKIQKADFQYPIILSHDGKILDGVHRICRAYLDGRATIPAVKFDVDPEPDYKYLLNE